MNPDVLVLVEHLRGEVADISYVMLAAARALARGTGGRVIALLLGHQAQELARDLAADHVWYLDHPALAEFTSDAYQRALTPLLREQRPRAALFGDTSIGAEVAGVLSARLAWPLVSRCRSVCADDGRLRFTSQICGGKVMAEGDLPGPTALVAMVPGGFRPDEGRSQQPPPVTPMEAPALEGLRVSLRRYIEPEAGDVDIAKEPLLVAVGRGIQNQDNLGLAEDLAAVLGAVVCGSRPVVDQGWLPTTRLVGRSGKRVRPKVYLALGISGAPEHVEAITDSEAIIAVNTDPAAPIFAVARYGAVADMLDLLPALTAQVQQAKGG
jgi:electron transfer flavoprotein alpha subunit